MSNEKKILQGITNRPPLERADNEFLWNTGLQLSLSSGIFFLYIFLRPKVKWLYSPNIQGKRSHPCYNYTGYLNWMIPIFTVEDTKLLTLIGLDAFMMLQTLKFLFKIFLFLCITVLPVIGYIYWNYFLYLGKPSTQYLTRMSIGTRSTSEMSYYLILFYGYFISAFVFYLIYIYYKRYTVLRQLYLRNPAILTSIFTLKKLSKHLSSPEQAADYLSLSNRTILVSNLPNFINTDNDLKIFFEEMQLGEIENSVILYDTYSLRKLYEEKNETIESIEKEINQTVVKMNKWSQKNRKDCEESFQHFSESLENTVNSVLLDEYVDDSKKIHMLKIFADTDDNFKTYLKNREKALSFFFDQLKILYEKIKNEKEYIKNLENQDNTENITELVSEQNALYIPGHIDKDASFFSFYHIFHMKKYWPYFALDFPIGAKKGFIVFKEFKDASIVKQAKIGSKIFSVEAQDAPTPNDIIWENINKSSLISFLFKAFGNIAFTIFNVIFAYLAVQTIEMVNLDRFKENGFLIKFFNDHHAIRDFYTGIVPALVYNLLLLIVPIVITTLVNLEGIYSYSAAQKRTMSRYANFLFFNAFLSVFFAATIYSSFIELISDKLTFKEFILELGNKIITSVVLFINTAVQKSLFGTSMLLLKPGPLIVNHFLKNLFMKKTRRQKEQAEFAPPFDFGSMFPELLIVFPMLFSYTLIFPFVLVLGLFYFGLIYLFYKGDFLYSSMNHYESGGKFWEQAVTLIIYSVLSFQVATAAVLFYHNEKFIAFMFLPLFYVTLNFNSNLDDIFSKSCNSYPLNFHEGVYLDEFTEKLKKDRINLLENWDEESQTKDIDSLNIDEFGHIDDRDVGQDSYYKDPSTSTNITNLMLPKNFFKLLFVLKKFDKSNFFGYKNYDI